MRRPGRNRSGQAYSLTVLTVVRRGEVNALAQRLAALPTGAASPLARVPGTHFARWVIVDDVVYEGPPQRRDHLKAARLLFTSNFDGPLEDYLDRMCAELGNDADDIWGACAGYPGSHDPAAWVAWLTIHQIDSALFFAAYGDQTVGRVQTNLERRARLMQFVLDNRGAPPAELQARFNQAFPR